MFKKTLISLAVASSLGLTGCLSGGDEGANANPDYLISNPDIDGKTWPLFNPVKKELPLPSDLNFDQVAKDGSYGVDGDLTNPVIGALNKMSGASTVAPAVIRFSGKIDADSVDSRAFIQNPAAGQQGQPPIIPNPNQNVFLIELQYASEAPVRTFSLGEPPTVPLAVTALVASGAPGAPATDLQGRDQAAAGMYLGGLAMSPAYDHDVVELDGDSAIRIRPNKPLNPGKRYIVAITDGVKDVNGDPITGDPVYQNVRTPNAPVGTPALKSVQSLATGLWEPVTEKYFGLNNQSRAGFGLSPLTKDNIALSYSFTTSDDVKVLSYIANPATWIADQVKAKVQVTEVTLRVAAAKVFSSQVTGKPTGLSPAIFGLPETASDDLVKAAVIMGLGKDPATEVVEPSDFLSPGNSDPASFGFADTAHYTAVAVGSFNPSTDLSEDPKPGLVPCDAEPYTTPLGTFTDQFLCVGTLLEASLKGGLAATLHSLPEPRGDRNYSLGAATDAFAISAVLTSLNFAPGDVSIYSNGSIDLPQYIAVPDATQTGATSTIRTLSWQPDAAVAGIIGDALNATIPQEDPTVSTVLNYNFPFPKEQDVVTVPMLTITPSGMDPTVAGSNLIPVIFQHGITTDRSAALAFGSQLVASAAGAGLNLAVFAIDQPLHGVSPVTVAEKEGLATKLLVAGNVLDPADLDPMTPEAQGTIDAAVAGTLRFGTVIEIQAELDRAIPTGAPHLGITDPTDPAQLQAAVMKVLNGDVDGLAPTAKPTLQGAMLVEQTVANAGSTIPGLAPANTSTGFASGQVNERHYGFTAGADGNPVAMDFGQGFGSSGSLFINLTNFPNTRDILRQGAVDLMNLTATINVMPGINNSMGVTFIGHSLGTLNGGAFVGASTASGNADLLISAAHLLTPVAGTTRLLENSPSFAPTILGGLQQAAGLTQGDADLETFLNVNQAMLDSVDPINFANELAVSNTVLAQVEGDRTTPNAADVRFGADNGPLNITFPNGLTVKSLAAPLTGSEALAALMGASSLTPADTVTGGGLPAITRYTNGVHGTPALPQEEIAKAGDVLKDRTIAQGGEVVVSEGDAQVTFGAMIQQTLQLIGSQMPQP
ncbi:hypothetical protein [Marinobacter sp.]|uniref:hypothetical protein n=1 Tax=Marinobacter sp. TaxID=50741 RepID=UPI003A906C5A